MWEAVTDLAVYEWEKDYDRRKLLNSPPARTMNSLIDTDKTINKDSESGTTAAGVCGITGASIVGGGVGGGVSVGLSSLGVAQNIAILFGIFAALPAAVIGGAATAVCIYKVEGCIDAKKLDENNPNETTSLNLQ